MMRKFLAVTGILFISMMMYLELGVQSNTGNPIAAHIADYKIQIRSIDSMIADIQHHLPSNREFSLAALDAHIDIASLKARKQALKASIDFLQAQIHTTKTF